MSTREILRVTREVPGSPGVRNPSPGPTDVTYIRLDKGNNFPERPEPIFYTVRGAEGNNRRIQTGSQQTKTAWSLDTLLYASQAKILLPAACTPVAGPPEALPTLTIDHAIMMEGGATYVYEGYLGCTVGSLDLSANDQGEGILFRTKYAGAYMSIDETVTGITFPTPALSAYPQDQPQVFQFLANQVTYRASRSAFRSFGLTVKNMLDVIYDESTTPLAINMYGRDVDWHADFRYRATQDRTDYENVTANTATIAIYDGTNTITFNLHSKNYARSVKDSLPLDKAFYQAVAVASYLDETAGSDMDLSITP